MSEVSFLFVVFLILRTHPRQSRLLTPSRGAKPVAHTLAAQRPLHTDTMGFFSSLGFGSDSDSDSSSSESELSELEDEIECAPLLLRLRLRVLLGSAPP